MLCGGERSGGRGEDDDLAKINDKTNGKIFDKNYKDLHKNHKKNFYKIDRDVRNKFD